MCINVSVGVQTQHIAAHGMDNIPEEDLPYLQVSPSEDPTNLDLIVEYDDKKIWIIVDREDLSKAIRVCEVATEGCSEESE